MTGGYKKKITSCKFAYIRLGEQYPSTRQFHALASNEKSIVAAATSYAAAQWETNYEITILSDFRLPAQWRGQTVEQIERWKRDRRRPIGDRSDTSFASVEKRIMISIRRCGISVTML